jgi:hypothetical protein
MNTTIMTPMTSSFLLADADVGFGAGFFGL